jgi:hypothetical protein
MKHLVLTLFAVILVLSIGLVSFIIVPGGENLISGKATAQVYIYETPEKGCAVNLTEGINMVSFYCETGDSSINDALIDINNNSLNYSAVFIYNPNDPLDSWSSFNPSLPSWAVQALSSLNRRSGFVIQMNETGEYYKSGYRFMSTTIDLHSGWNFIGYPSDVEINITDALVQINGMYTQVETYTPVNGTKTWLYHVPPSSGTLLNMAPMVGYWIYMNQDAQIVINW